MSNITPKLFRNSKKVIFWSESSIPEHQPLSVFILKNPVFDDYFFHHCFHDFSGGREKTLKTDENSFFSIFTPKWSHFIKVSVFFKTETHPNSSPLPVSFFHDTSHGWCDVYILNFSDAKRICRYFLNLIHGQKDFVTDFLICGLETRKNH